MSFCGSKAVRKRPIAELKRPRCGHAVLAALLALTFACNKTHSRIMSLEGVEASGGSEVQFGPNKVCGPP